MNGGGCGDGCDGVDVDAVVWNYYVADDSVRGVVYSDGSLMPCAERGVPKCFVCW